MPSKYRPIHIDENGVRTMFEKGYVCMPEVWRKILEMPITVEG